LAEVTPESSGKFVHRVKDLLEAITGKPYGIVEKQRLKGRIWGVYLDEDKVKLAKGVSMNRGAQLVYEVKDDVIYVHSNFFYDVGDVASEQYGFHFRDVNALQDRKNWNSYRKEVPGLIVELEAAERAAKEANAKYGISIALKFSLGHYPYLETSFNAKGMSEGEKLQEIKRHARAMYETWGCWREWASTEGRDIYVKTTKRRQSQIKFLDAVDSKLNKITKSWYSEVMFKKPGVRWALVGWVRLESLPENRGVWLVEERKDSIAIFSDNFETINARNELEYNSIKVMGGLTAGGYEEQFNMLYAHDEVDEHGMKISRPITPQEAMKYGRKTSISPKLLIDIAKKVGREFKVDIRVMKDKPVLMTEFKTKGLKQQEKLHEIERRAKALAEAWNRIKKLAKGVEDTEA